MFANSQPSASGIELGTIGWDTDGDDDDHYDLGTEDNDGYTLVRVQLYRGSDDSKVLPKDGRAHGTKMIAHIDGTIQHIPTKGTRCWVAIPNGLETNAASGVVIATAQRSVDGRLDKERIVFDYGERDVLIKARSVGISDNEDNFFSVGKARSGGDESIQFRTADGTGMKCVGNSLAFFTNNNGTVGAIFQMKSTAVEMFVQSSATALKLNSLGFVMTSNQQGFIMPQFLWLGPPDAATWKPVGTGIIGITNKNIAISSAV